MTFEKLSADTKIIEAEEDSHDREEFMGQDETNIIGSRVNQKVHRDLSVFQGQSPLRSTREYAYCEIYGEETLQFGETNPIFSS